MEHRIPVTVSRFFGIIISMYYNNRQLPPHFNVCYEKQTAAVDIQQLTILQGQLTPRLHGLVIEWASLHKTELLKNWELAKNNAPLEKIKPLE